jgi:hypothetical protein
MKDQLQALDDLLGSYFGEGFRDGADELALVTEGEIHKQEAYLAVLDGGIAAAARGDCDVALAIQHGLGGPEPQLDEAKCILEQVRAEYVSAVARLEGKCVAIVRVEDK